MAGLDKIISQIRKEAEESAAQIIAAARDEAEQVLAKAREEAEAEGEKISRNSEREVKDTLERGRSAADLRKRKGLLAHKQKLIGEVLEEALNTMKGMEPEPYFEAVVKLAEKSAMEGEGIIYFSESDLKRLPRGMEKKLNAALKEKKASLHVSEEAREIDGGFVLSYGGIEENCSFDALFDSAHERLQDIVQKILFA